MPSFRPPAVVTGPKVVTLLGSYCPEASTQAAANQYTLRGDSSITVELPEENGMSTSPVRAIALVISCSAAHILVLPGSSSSHIDHSMTRLPAVPPDIASATNHSGGLGISSVGVTLPGHAIASPIVPSGYSIAMAALYNLSSDNASVTPSLSASVTITEVCDQNGIVM